MRGKVISLNIVEEDRSSSSFREKKIIFIIKEEIICVSLKQEGWVLGWCEGASKEIKDYIQNYVLGEIAEPVGRGDACICLRVKLNERELIEIFEKAGCKILKERKCPRERKSCYIVAEAE
ncbi:MAG: hypothetical protein PHZ25_01570 [Candidatus Pacebacteria bacterium]|nr:hypothetical protein [Candidatus Paceibacterota bacterium]